MVILGGWAFLMSEVPLHTGLLEETRALTPVASSWHPCLGPQQPWRMPETPGADASQLETDTGQLETNASQLEKKQGRTPVKSK